jgi:hypothetical protein
MSYQKILPIIFTVFCSNAKADVVLKNVNLKITPENTLVQCMIESAAAQLQSGSSSLVPIDSYIEPADDTGFSMFASVEFSVSKNTAIETYKIRIATMDKYAGWFYNSDNVPYTVVSAVLASLEKVPTGEPVSFIDMEMCQ